MYLIFAPIAIGAYLLGSIPATSGNLLRIEDAVNIDLAWLEEKTVSVSLVALNRVQIEITAADRRFTYIGD